MAETIVVSCPGCKVRLKVPADKKAVKCPKCGTAVRVHDVTAKEDDPDLNRLTSKAKIIERVEDEDEDEEDQPRSRRPRDEDEERPARRRRRDEDDEDEEDESPARRRRRDEDDDEDEDDRPRSRRRRRDEDEDEDDRPRRGKRRRRRRMEEGDGPYALAAAITVACFFLTFGGALVVKGGEGLAPGEDGPGGKLFGLGFMFLVSLVLMPLGVFSVKQRKAYGKWGIEVTGTMGVILGMIQAVVGGLMGGFALYGVIFTLVNGY